MLTSAGHLLVSARFGRDGLGPLSVALHRPDIAARFAGLPAEMAVERVAQLYSLCTSAQRTAAQAAVCVARATAAPPPDHRALWVEFLHENLWRLLLDWPPALGLPPAGGAFAAWRIRRQAPDVALATRSLWEAVLMPLAAECHRRLPGGDDDADAALAREFSPASWLTGEWLRHWQDGSQAPQQPVPPSVAAAYRRRVGAVALAVRALADEQAFPVASAGGEGWGIGQTLTARGILTHAVQLGAQGVVARYRIEAPTDRFFADAGPLSDLLAVCEIPSLDQARQAGNRAILALDPCLPYTLEFHDA